MKIRDLAPFAVLVLPLAASCGGEEGADPFADPTASGGGGGLATGGVGNAVIGSGGVGNTVGTGGTGNVANTGGSGSGLPTGGVGNGPSTGGVGNTGNLPSTGGTGNTGNTPSTGGTGNLPSTGGTGNVVSTGGVGNVANTGGVGNTGNTPSTGGVAVNCTNIPPDSSGTTCDMWAEWGECGNSWIADGGFCMESCGACGTSNTGGVGNTGNTGGTGNTGNVATTGGVGNTGNTGGTGNVQNPPPLQNPQDGHATHYWDCCKPSCAWPDQGSARSCDGNNNPIGDPNTQSACAGGSAYQCWSMAPWSLSSTLAYGFAAHNDGSCGTCYQLEFTGTSSSGYDDPGSASLVGKVMIVQTLNRGGIGGGQFDLLIPGGGVGDFDACSSSWGTSDLGERYGGFFLACRNQNNGNLEAAKSCARSKCEQVFAGKADLLDGCLFWVDWANMADNPNFRYGQVNCPSEISSASGM